jgi:hypothetical protein
LTNLFAGLDIQTISYLGSFAFMFIFIFFGQKIQIATMLGQISKGMKKLALARDVALSTLKAHLQKYVQMTPEQEKDLAILVDSIAIPPVSNLDPAGMVPKMENIFKTYDRYLKAGLRKIVNKPSVEPISQSDLETLENSLEVAIELTTFYKVVDHFFRQAKKGNLMSAVMIVYALPQLLEMAEALKAAAGHFQSGLPIGDGFGPMVAQRFVKDSTGLEDISRDPETSVYDTEFEGRRVFVVKAKGPGGSVGNPGIITQSVIQQTNPALVITVDAASKMESETTGEVSEGVGVAMGGPGMDRYRIEEALAGLSVPVLTIVCKMSMKEAISQMPKAVLDQVDPVYQRVLRMIKENSAEGETVVVLGVGNTMGVN